MLCGNDFELQPVNTDVFSAVACLRRQRATTGNTSAFAGYFEPSALSVVLTKYM